MHAKGKINDISIIYYPRAALVGQGCKKFRRSARTETAAGVISFGWKTPSDQSIAAGALVDDQSISQIGVETFPTANILLCDGPGYLDSFRGGIS